MKADFVFTLILLFYYIACIYAPDLKPGHGSALPNDPKKFDPEKTKELKERITQSQESFLNTKQKTDSKPGHNPVSADDPNINNGHGLPDLAERMSLLKGSLSQREQNPESPALKGGDGSRNPGDEPRPSKSAVALPGSPTK